MGDPAQTTGIIGRGAIGSALGGLLERAGRRVVYWDIDAAKRTVASQDDLTRQSGIIFLTIPSWIHREVASQIRLNGGERKLVISLAKGTDKDFILIDEVLQVASAGHFDYGLLFGPMLAEELAAGKPTAAVLALSDQRRFGCLDVLAEHGLSIHYSTDTHGVAACGALKNIYAVAFGIHDGLDLGLNAKGVLAVKILAEMKQVLQQLGAEPQLADGLAGIGDLLATGWSESSFNHRIGKAIAEKIAPEAMHGEGVNALRDINAVLDLTNFPILSLLQQIVFNDHDPQLLETLIG